METENRAAEITKQRIPAHRAARGGDDAAGAHLPVVAATDRAGGSGDKEQAR